VVAVGRGLVCGARQFFGMRGVREQLLPADNGGSA